MIDGKNFFGLPVKNDLITWNIATGQGDDDTTGCLLHYNYFKNYFNMIAIDLRKQKVLDSDSKTIRQISFTAKSNRQGQRAMHFIIEEAKETVLDFSQRTVSVF